MMEPATPPYEIKKYDGPWAVHDPCVSMLSPPEYTMDWKPRKKSVPHRSPTDQGHDKSITFQLDSTMAPHILHGTSLLWPLRQRVLKARTFKRVKPVKIQIPRPCVTPKPTIQSRKPSHSGRPSRIKGPCQACHETSDGCMRKAFDWPFSTDTEFNDKGKPFVYLCNKCGLRYNKSGGCVCRHCRWVLCKEEKRKAIQLIDSMRRFKTDGKIDPDDDIETFICNPKYWPCGHTWKVGWILTSQDVDEDSIYSSDDTL